MSGDRIATPAWLTLLRALGAGALVALLIASVEWGGLDRGLMDRFSAGLWTFLAATTLIDAVISHRSGLPRANTAYLLTGCAGAACMAVAQLSRGVLGGLFLAAAAAFIVMSLVAARRYTRAVDRQAVSVNR